MPTKKDTPNKHESNTLLSYRLEQVEAAVRDMGEKIDKQDNIKKSDLIELRDTILSRFNEIRDNLQKQIDGLLLDKADQKQVDDLRTLVKAVGAFLSSVIGALVFYYLTNRGK